MKNIKKINDEILSLTARIRKDFPELVKYLSEMPEHFQDDENDEIDSKDYLDYLDSLKQIVEAYSKAQAVKE